MRLQREWVWAGGLVLALVLVLLLPTVVTLRTLEEHPDAEPVALGGDTVLESIVRAPADRLNHVTVWPRERHRDDTLTEADYAGLQLDVRSTDGEVLREATTPQFTRRRGLPALVFSFASLSPADISHYQLTLRQAGDGIVWLESPLSEMAKDDESFATALELGKRSNWLAHLLHRVYREDPVRHDIAAYHHRGTQIVEGANPYTCVRKPEETCTGYPSHLPGMYLFSAGLIGLGYNGLTEWVALWRPIMLAAWLGTGAVLLAYGVRRGFPALAVASLGVWLFNRWSLAVLRVSHTDFVGVLLVVVAAVLTKRWPLIAATLLGASLAVKPVAVLLVPLFLIVVWRQQPGWKRFALMVGLLLLIPFLTTLPFLLTDFSATVQGILTPATRAAQSHYAGAPSFDQWLDVVGPSKSVLLLLLVGMVYLGTWRRRIDFISGGLLVMTIIIAFTHVLFHQYVIWLIPFIPLTVLGLLHDRNR